MWLPQLAFFPLLLYLLPACIALKAKKRRKKSVRSDSKASSISDEVSRSPATTTRSMTPPTDSTLGKKSDQQRSVKDENELFKQLKMDKNQIARVKELPKKEQENWKKWARLNLTKEIDRADSYYLEHDCKGLMKNNCKGCKDYLKLIKTLRTYQHRYGSLSPAPSNEQEVKGVVKELEQRAFWFGMTWNKQKFVKAEEDAKAKQIVNNDKKRHQKLKKIIKDWKKAKKKREEEKQKLEKKRLAQLKKEMELKKKKEQKQEAVQADESRYESMYMEGVPAERNQVVTNCQYENLIDEAGQKKEKKKVIVDESKYENLMDASAWEAEKKSAVEKKKEEKPKPKIEPKPEPKMEKGYESLFDAVGGEPVTEKVSEDKVPKEKKRQQPEMPEKKPPLEIKKSVQKMSSQTMYTAVSPDDSSSSDNNDNS